MIPSSFVRKALIACLALLIVPWAVAQQGSGGGGQQGGGTGGGTGGAAGGGSTGGSKGDAKTTPVPVTPSPDKKQEQPRLQTIFISGVVVMEDGSPVPTGAVIERSCNGRVTREAYVSPGGGFSFQIGGNQPSSMMPDASDTFEDFSSGRSSTGGWSGGRIGSGGIDNGFGSASFALMGCEVQAQLAGYRSTRVILDGSALSAGQVNAGTILLVPMTRVRGTMVSATNLNAPKPARKALEKGQSALNKKKYQDAEKQLKEAVGQYPNYAAAFSTLGELYHATDRLPEARQSYEKAIELDDKYVEPYIGLARLAGSERKWQETADLTDKALLLDPVDFPQGYFYNAVAHYNLRNFEAAERSARKVQMLDPQHRMPQTFMILANILEQKKDLDGAVDQLQKYVSAAPQAPNIAEIRVRLQQLREQKPVAEKK